MHASTYVGRFAPTPSGHLHFGSLLAALASYLDARHHGGQWLMRMEDLDKPREVAGSADAILHTLDAYGLHWDGPVVRQSEQIERYQTLVDRWLESGQAFYCDCSRRVLQDHEVYPGNCRDRRLPGDATHAVRVRVPAQTIGFVDRLQGAFYQNLQREVGDFVIRRRDGIIAYQLAVVVDDVVQGVNQVVRGADLMDSTPRQLWLYRLLEAPQPAYLHIPLIMRPDGQKLSKRLASPPLDPTQAPATLDRALRALGQTPPADLAGAPVEELLTWAVENWQPGAMPAVIQRLEAELEPR